MSCCGGSGRFVPRVVRTAARRTPHRLFGRLPRMLVKVSETRGDASMLSASGFFGNFNPGRDTNYVNSSSEGLADRALVSRVLAGDAQARREFSERLVCVPRFLGFLNRRFGRLLRDDALDEVAQEVFVRVVDKLADFEGSAKLESWIFRFCANTFQNATRATLRKVHRERGSEDDLSAVADVENSAFARVDLLWVHSALERLDATDRGIVEERHFSHREFPEIATRIGMTVSAVKTRYYKALEKMKGFLTPRFGVEVEGGT